MSDIIDALRDAFGDNEGLCYEAGHEISVLEATIERLESCGIQDMQEALEFALEAPGEIQKIMTDNNLVIDDHDDKMQKFAFTIYTKLVAVADKAERALKGDENA
ncbi:hypothetical protein LCGC14_0344620 [marine sediment metagenome]|uniref:Uncharacterized protein n=1 Tax=marine sediment metagenome TaxID=412755 RepID=A0A0F9VZZ7_9ZZZZ